MEKLFKVMNERVKLLQKTIKKANSEKESFPQGTLRISNSGNRLRLYQKLEGGKPDGNYIPKKDRKLALQLAQKEYNRKFLNNAQRELQILENTIASLSRSNADSVFLNLNPSRQKLVTPYIMTDDLFENWWKTRPYKTNLYMESEKKYDTRRGEKVRSKSEAILADIMGELGIPYRYEQEIHLKDGRVKYPDFTLLNVKKREVIYLEHLGLLDDVDYRNNNLRKLDEYRDNGIFIGKNLLITYETMDCPLDIRGIRKMLKEIFYN